MRTLLILLLAGGLAWGLWSLLGTDEDEAVDALPPPSTPPTVAPPPSSEGPVATTMTPEGPQAAPRLRWISASVIELPPLERTFISVAGVT